MPVNARALVGWTEGAKKRAARRAGWVRVPPLSSLEACERECRAILKRVFRIGKCLRPCPGCGRDPSSYSGPGICCDGSGVIAFQRRERPHAG